MRTLFVSIVLLSSIACTTPATAANTTTVDSPMPRDGKAVAPVDVRAELSATQARVTVKLEEPGSDVSISIRGIDGLEVGSPNSFAGSSLVTRGDTQTVTVSLGPTTGRSNLVVSVEGVFHGAKLTRVASFAIGDGPLKPRGEVITTDEGMKIKGQAAPTAPATPSPVEGHRAQ